MKTSRRDFIRAGGALVVYFALPGSGVAQYISPNPGLADQPGGNASLDTWIRIEEGGRIVISAGKVSWARASGPRWPKLPPRNWMSICRA